eukprot:scaffold1724_cov158-Amphora_coffeaeformis.AAC.5
MVHLVRNVNVHLLAKWNVTINTTTKDNTSIVSNDSTHDEDCRVAFVPLSDSFPEKRPSPNQQSFSSSSSSSSPPPPPPFCTSRQQIRVFFIHVGKTGGMSLSTSLDLDRQTQRNFECQTSTSTSTSRQRWWYWRWWTSHKDDDVCLVQQQQQQQQQYTLPPRLAQHVYGIAHSGLAHHWSDEKMAWLHRHTNVLLVTVRDPVDRLVSAFYYEQSRPRAIVKVSNNNKNATTLRTQFFEHCFPTLAHLADALDTHHESSSSSSSSSSLDCRQLGMDVLQGRAIRGQTLGHLYYNYEHYARQYYHNNISSSSTNNNNNNTNNNKKAVVVVRTRHMWDDVARLEAWLGGDPKRFGGTNTTTATIHDAANNNQYPHPPPLPSPQQKLWHVTHGSGNYTRVTADQAAVLCRILVRELQVYQEWILAAMNLNQDEKETALRATFTRCGVPSTSSSSIESLSWADLARWDWQAYYDSDTYKIEQHTYVIGETISTPP